MLTPRYVLFFALMACGQGPAPTAPSELAPSRQRGRAALIYRTPATPLPRTALSADESLARHAQQFSHEDLVQVPQATGGAILNLSGRFRHQAVVHVKAGNPTGELEIGCERAGGKRHAK